jgi:hypothetical protein
MEFFNNLSGFGFIQLAFSRQQRSQSSSCCAFHKSDLVTVGQGKIAYVFARDGVPLGDS